MTMPDAPSPAAGAPAPAAPPCRACGGVLVEDAPFCHHCGITIRGGARHPALRWYYRPWVVLLAISPFVLGPFGLPLLWKSPRFSRAAKLAWTVATLLWTGLFVWYVTVKIVPAVTHEMQQLDVLFSY